MDNKLFGKYGYEGISVEDISVKPYINLEPTVVPHSHGRHSKSSLDKSNVNIVERLVNKLMRGGTGAKLGGKVIRTSGRLQGKKSTSMKIVKDAFAIAFEKTKENPIQLLVTAVENAAPREDFTRVAMGGVSYQVAVDISPSRRVDVALRNISLAAITRSFKNTKTLAEALADELMYAGKGDTQNSYAIKKRDEIERMARSAR